MTQGYLTLVLHAHLPFVRHPEHASFLEEDWLFEAITETYIPLLRVLRGWHDDAVPYRLSLTLTPTLLSMLGDEMLGERYERHLKHLTELADKELDRTRGQGHLHYLANHYRAQIETTWQVWRQHEGRLVDGFRAAADTGQLEILTSAATHGYLPLLRANREAVRAQVAIGVRVYEQFLGRAPRGFWLPECGYYPGLDRVLTDHGIRYVIMDAHGVLFGHPRPKYGAYAPVYAEGSQLAVFGRDLESALQVWSRDHGYPGDPVYRDFYRDIGFDLDLDYIGPWVQPDGTRKHTGIKYHRITGKDVEKELYDPHWAREKAAEHAANFVLNRQRQCEYLRRTLGREPVVVSPYDAELFGHWWYEGPWWLDAVVRQVSAEPGPLTLTHPPDYLRDHPTQQILHPAESSWGDQGYHGFWLNDTNGWVYPHLHKAAERMTDLARKHPEADGLLRRALTQAARELLLAQSSDWAFIMKTGTVVDYATRRTLNHLRRFTKIFENVTSGEIDPEWLGRLETLDNLFPDLDYRVFA
jgi:1,4-alpha-glucan branching enzyme